MQWGDNEHGQMGNQKRSPLMVPVILRYFKGKKIVGVFAGENNSAVIIEKDQKK